MTADLLIHGISELVTPTAPGPVHGRAMRDLRITREAAIAIRAGTVVWCGPERDWVGTAASTHDCRNAAVVPALIDPHTHAVWAGDRLADFEARVSGVAYETILAAGGGIRSTVRATAQTSVEQLAALATPRIGALLRSGAATIEVKSGYGLDPDAELRMLEAIALLATQVSARIVATLLIHIPPSEIAQRQPYLVHVREELIPEVARRGLAQAIDIFVEKEAWTAAEAATLIDVARAYGLAAKLHTEQFHRVGGLELGLEKSVLSVDHLEACDPAQIAAFASSGTVATVLPGVTLHLGIPGAPGRALIDAGAAVAVGTDLNPGSSPLYSTAAALALAVRLNGLTIAEALTAGTVNSAAALGLHDCGRIAISQRADFLELASADWRDLLYTLGANPIRQTWITGKCLFS